MALDGAPRVIASIRHQDEAEEPRVHADAHQQIPKYRRPMGLECSYQAIHGNSLILELARHDPEVAEWVGLVPFWIRRKCEDGLAPGSPEAGELKLWKAVEAYARTVPGLTTRSCYLGKRWDLLNYVLSANRRGETGSERDVLADIAIRGEAPVGVGVVGGQGVPVKFTCAETVSRVAKFLESISLDSLKRHVVPERLEAAAVYKCSAHDATDEGWGALRKQFEELRALYESATTHGEGVLVSMD